MYSSSFSKKGIYYYASNGVIKNKRIKKRLVDSFFSKMKISPLSPWNSWTLIAISHGQSSISGHSRIPMLLTADSDAIYRSHPLLRWVSMVFLFCFQRTTIKRGLKRKDRFIIIPPFFYTCAHTTTIFFCFLSLREHSYGNRPPISLNPIRSRT